MKIKICFSEMLFHHFQKLKVITLYQFRRIWWIARRKWSKAKQTCCTWSVQELDELFFPVDIKWTFQIFFNRLFLCNFLSKYYLMCILCFHSYLTICSSGIRRIWWIARRKWSKSKQTFAAMPWSVQELNELFFQWM